MELFTEIEINATSEKVWQVLTDFASYPEWNPFVLSLNGRIEVGERIQAFLQPPNKKGMTFKPRVIKFVPRREFRWFGSLGFRGLFDGEHIFELRSPSPHKVHFVQREVFKGILAPVILKSISKNTRAGFELMNQALKERCEE